MSEKPLILITNDDSVAAPGLGHLIDCVRDYGQLIAVAPRDPKSGQSAAFTGNQAMRYSLDHYRGHTPVYQVSGTPVDCVKLAMHTILPRRPDLVIAGVNHGSNAGNCVVYSGTMGAVIEGCMEGIPAIGYSLTHHSWEADFTQTTRFIKEITQAVLEKGLPDGVCLNVNFPARCKIRGLKACRAARGYWTDEYADYVDPNGKPFFWLTGNFINKEPGDPTTDEYWLAQEYATVVPVRPDNTARDRIPTIASLLGCPEAMPDESHGTD